MRALNWALSFGLLVLGACGAITDLEEIAEDSEWATAGAQSGLFGGSGGSTAGKGGRPSTGASGKNAGGKGTSKSGGGRGGKSDGTSGAPIGGTAGNGVGGRPLGGFVGVAGTPQAAGAFAFSGSGGTAIGGFAGIGGSPGGASGSAGSAGSPVAGAPSGPPPEGCTLSRESADANYCFYEAQCEENYLYTSCQKGTDGRWHCECTRPFTSYIVDASSGAPCNAVARMCNEASDYAGPEECKTETSWSSSTQCDRQYACTRPLSGAPGISEVVRNRYVNCFSDNDRGNNCSCDGRGYWVEGVDGTAACDVTEHLCTADIDYDDPVCHSISGTSVAGQSCGVTTECTERTKLEGEVIAQRWGARSADCQKSPNGEGSTCTCLADGAWLSFELDLPPELAICHQALEVCTTPQSLTIEGPLECKVSSQDVDQEHCYSSFTCSRSGTYGDVPVLAHSVVTTSCQTSGESWACLCATATEEVSTRIVPQGSDWDSCTAAANKCRELVELPIGPASTE